jgi:hypothetical protein
MHHALIRQRFPWEPPSYAAPQCPWVAAAAAVAGAVISAVGTVASAQAQANQASYQAQVARNNQIIADRNAADALKRYAIEEDKVRQRTASIMGSQRAKLAGQGAALDEGSPLDIQMDTAGLGELDALTVRSVGEREAYGFKVQGMNYAAQSKLYEMNTNMLPAYLAAGGSILGGAGRAFMGMGGGGSTGGIAGGGQGARFG